jgi:hypothetical protein
MLILREIKELKKAPGGLDPLVSEALLELAEATEGLQEKLAKLISTQSSVRPDVGKKPRLRLVKSDAPVPLA